MHYAEFGEDEVGPRPNLRYICSMRTADQIQQSAALLAAIKEYDANKWKVIGAKVGKPAKVGRRASLVSKS